MQGQNSSSLRWLQPYRPLFFECLSGVTSVGNNRLLLCDRDRGLLTEVNLVTETEAFSSTYDPYDYVDVNSICYANGQLYSIDQNTIVVANYPANAGPLHQELVVAIPNCSDLTGIAVANSIIYVSTQNQSLLAYHLDTQVVEELGQAPGVGVDDLCYWNHQLLIVDAQEQTVYVFDLNRQQVVYELLTPYEHPTSITSVYHELAGRDLLYVSYSRPSFDVYDTGDSEFQLKLKTHVDVDRQQVLLTDNFIHPLTFKRDESRGITVSNGFLVEMSYVEKLHALPEVADAYETVQNIDWKISIPVTNDRQELVSLEKIGSFDMRIEEIDAESHQKAAVFSIPEINLKTERRVFGWKALVKVFGVRHAPHPDQLRAIAPEELAQYAAYLENEDGLDMDRRYVQDVAAEAIQHLSEPDQLSVLKKVEAIRDYIYQNVTYVMDQFHNGTEEVLRSGEGSCGEYLKVFLSLLRLNQIPVRACGNYKVPAYKMQAGAESVSLSPDFNHVWLQFYLPGYGWIPLESSADDQVASFRNWPKRYFGALAWYHLECRTGNYFEEVFETSSSKTFFLSAGDLAKNDIKFKVLHELVP
jgi:hypothetical protein